MILLERALDYAGLFPPASLDMAEAARSYAAYRKGRHRSLLGRFVVPVARLDELASASEGLIADDPDGVWELSVIGAGDPREESQRIADAESRHGGGGPSLSVRSIERPVQTAEEIADVVGGYHDAGGRSLYLELPLEPSRFGALLDAVAEAGAFAKLRAGSTSVDGFPATEVVARFVAACRDAGVAFKATAGLHHAMRGDYGVDYGASSPCATMHGFLNLFVGATLLDAGKIGEEELRAVLEERSPEAFEVGARAARWRDRAVGADEIRRARTRLLHSFGTCSFEEPVEEIRSMGKLA